MPFNKGTNDSADLSALIDREAAADVAKWVEEKRGIPAEDVLKDIYHFVSLGIDFSYYKKYYAWNLTEEETLYLKQELEARKKIQQERLEEVAAFISQRSGLDTETIKERYHLALEEGYRDVWFIIEGIYSLSPDEIRAHKYRHDLGIIEDYHDEQNQRFKKLRKAVRKEMSWKRGQDRLAFLAARNKCGCALDEFIIYGIYKMEEEQAKTFLTADLKRKAWFRNATTYERSRIFQDKLLFSEHFPEFMNRACFANTDLSYDEFLENIKSEKKIVYKLRTGGKGIGMEMHAVNESDEQNREVYNHLISLSPGIIEGYLTQHEDIAAFYPGSVNTIRVITALKDGKAHVAMAALRTGTSGFLDNWSQGGVSASVDPDSGIIETDGADFYGKRFVEHPVSGKRFRGFQIPNWDEVVRSVCGAAEKCPDMPFIGWDVAVLEGGKIALVEGNLNFGNKAVQTPCAMDGIGIRYRLEQYM